MIDAIFVLLCIPLAFAGGFIVWYECKPGGLFSWHGRMNRMSFFINLLIIIGAYVLTLFLLFFAIEHDLFVVLMGGGLILAMILIRSLCVTSRRFHDMGMPGYWSVILWIFNLVFGSTGFGVVFGLIADLAICLYPGKNESNKYGLPTEGVLLK